MKKVWNELADWAFQMGQRQLEVAVNNRVELTESEVKGVKQVLAGVSDRDREVVRGFISQISLKDSHSGGVRVREVGLYEEGTARHRGVGHGPGLGHPAAGRAVAGRVP